MSLEQIRHQNAEKLNEAINKLKVINYHTVSQLIPELLASEQLILDHSSYIPADANSSIGVGRYLIYDHPDKENSFSIWAFAFAPKQKTSIHDHRYEGTVTVLNEFISEKYYKPVSDHEAALKTRCDRDQFHTNYDDLTSNFVHQLKRCKHLGEGISVTLHIYKMEATMINDSGEPRDRRNLNKIYSKVKFFDKHAQSTYKKGEGAAFEPQRIGF
jgi:kynureninase